jgi:aryl-alcohol dehydrogenase-like predicted oxidoreductase
VYSLGNAERFLGEALRNLGVPRESYLIATKAYGPMGKGPNDVGTSRGHLLDAVKASLKRLSVDHIDLYQIHGFDPATPMEETLRALDDLVLQGYVRYVGVSNWAAWQIAKALGISAHLGLSRFNSLQAYYSIAGRDLEREIVPLLESEGVGLLVWGPLAGGLLSGKQARGEEAPDATKWPRGAQPAPSGRTANKPRTKSALQSPNAVARNPRIPRLGPPHHRRVVPHQIRQPN